jgi:hypothetical protein
MRNSRWVRLLAYVTGSVNQELLLRNEYLAAENRILRTKFPARLRLSDPERITLAEIGKRLGRKALREVACVAKPDTILAWYRRLVAQKFDGSKHRQYPGRPPVSSEIEALVVRMARENSGWGYDRICLSARMAITFTSWTRRPVFGCGLMSPSHNLPPNSSRRFFFMGGASIHIAQSNGPSK